MEPASSSPQSTQWWIISIAISVVCCAILFVVFAGYLVELNKSMAVSNVRFEVMEQRISRMDADIEYMRRRNTVQRIQVIPPDAPVQLPVSVLPAGEAAPGDSPASAAPASPSPAPVAPPAPAAAAPATAKTPTPSK